MKTVKWFSFLAGVAFGGSTAAITVNAAIGDLVYQAGGAEKEITGPQAACFADCAIASGSWDGNRASMIRTCAFRKGDGKFAAVTVGTKTAAQADLPVSDNGVVVLGVVE